jgi:hypothetical protein
MGKDPLMQWTYNNNRDADPRDLPADSREWEEIARKAGGKSARIVFSLANRWYLAVAEVLPPAHIGGGTVDTTPRDIRPTVIAALKAAGKPIGD